jgi:hypothetical protein
VLAGQPGMGEMGRLMNSSVLLMDGSSMARAMIMQT